MCVCVCVCVCVCACVLVCVHADVNAMSYKHTMICASLGLPTKYQTHTRVQYMRYTCRSMNTYIGMYTHTYIHMYTQTHRWVRWTGGQMLVPYLSTQARQKSPSRLSGVHHMYIRMYTCAHMHTCQCHIPYPGEADINFHMYMRIHTHMNTHMHMHIYMHATCIHLSSPHTEVQLSKWFRRVVGIPLTT